MEQVISFDSSKPVYADVILPLKISRTYTYEVPPHLISSIQFGIRVLAQFGKRKIYTGIVLNVHQNQPENFEIKDLLDVVDSEPVITKSQESFLAWIADYYMCSLGECYHAAIPSGLKLSSDSQIQLNPDYKEEFPFTEREQSIIDALAKEDTLGFEEIEKLIGIKTIHPIIQSLLKKNKILLLEAIKDKYTPKVIRKVRLKPEFNSKEGLEGLFKMLEKKQKQVDCLLLYLKLVPVQQNPAFNENGIEKNHFSENESSLKTLIKNEIFEEFEVVVSRFKGIERKSFSRKLTAEQQKALESIEENFHQKEVNLLYGITGSGKTEIYIELIRKTIDSGSQALLLLPEIALTTQIVKRLEQVFGEQMGIYHSKYSEKERVEVWKGLLENKFQFIIGVRSSLFLPFSHLGLIIVDEEHESSYKQQDPAPRYHARDAAMVLARMHHAKVLLGTGTPSVETYYQANEGKYGLIKLENRYANASLPEIHLINMRQERKNKNVQLDFSGLLVNQIKETITKKEQVIVFRNRRGYSPFVACEECAYIPKCKNCAVSLTYHQFQTVLRCHYCGFTQGVLHQCPSCNSSKIRTVGAGTEKIEEDLGLLIPEASVTRMDLETTRNKGAYQRILEEFEEGKTDILVGTQMVTKGLDFDNVTLVAVTDADSMIHFPDFRSHERTFQTITQVSGRAGRKKIKGNVYVQTMDVDQKIFARIINHDFQGFYEEEIAEREQFHYPPFVRMIRLTIKDKDKKVSSNAADELFGMLLKKLGKERVLGPDIPAINKVRNFYLNEIVIKIFRDKDPAAKVKQIISEEIINLMKNRDFRNTIVVPDVDPV